jgi:hypothetical protein
MNYPVVKKIMYATQSAAWKVIRNMRKRSRCDNGHSLHAYRCNACGGWHLGHDALGIGRRKRLARMRLRDDLRD